MGYEILNILFFVFHTALVLFNCLGWIWKKTRRWNLFTLLLTAASWFIVGIWKGWGYCYCTDWHWQVRHKMGIYDHSNSYIHFLILKLTGVNIDVNLVEKATLVVFIIAFVLSVFFNLSDLMRSKKIKSNSNT